MMSPNRSGAVSLEVGRLESSRSYYVLPVGGALSTPVQSLHLKCLPIPMPVPNATCPAQKWKWGAEKRTPRQPALFLGPHSVCDI